MFENIKLTNKILILLSVAIFGMFTISAFSYFGLNKIGAEIEEIAEYQIPINTLITELEKDILEEEILTYELIIESKDVHSQKFKDLEHEIDELEKETDKTLKKAEHLVEKAIEHNNDEKTKNTYKIFLKELKKLEHEKKKFEVSLTKFEHDLESGNLKNIEHEKEILHEELELMDNNIQKLMSQMQKLLEHSTHQAEEDEHEILKLIEIVSAIVFLLTIILSFFFIKEIKKNIANFQEGLVGFFKYLNKENTDVLLLNDKSSDEFGNMSKIINRNITTTKEIIEDDQLFLNEVQVIVEEINKGYLSSRLVNNVKSENLEKLRNSFNEMLENLNKNIGKDTNKIIEVLNNFGKLDFRDKIENDNGKVVGSLNNLGELITEMLIENKSIGLTLENNSNILLDNVSSLNTNANNAAAALEETSAALEEITSTIISTTENISQVAKYSDTLTESINAGQVLATSTVESMNEINNQTQAIADAITVIDKIAFQTNILSLNAAVEAATAGEAGKGFAVVAQEVRNLASRSAEAAKEIKELVENATVKTDAGKQNADTMILGYDELNMNIKKTTKTISDIASASQEQQLGIEQINDAVTSLDQQTQEIASISNKTQDVANQTDNIAKLIVEKADEKEFHGKHDVSANV